MGNTEMGTITLTSLQELIKHITETMSWSRMACGDFPSIIIEGKMPEVILITILRKIL